MGDTDRDKKIEVEKKENVQQEPIKLPINITVGNFMLAILVILIVVTGALVYYLNFTAKQDEQYNDMLQNVVEKENTINRDNDTIKNIIDSALESTSSTPTITNTVDAVDANDRKILNENLIVLYNGLILDTTKMGKTELKYIDNSDKYKDKYVITYYNYDNFSFKESKLGILSTQIYDGLVKIDNVGKVAISESYNAIPREIKIVNAIPSIALDKNPTLGEFDLSKVIITDLDGNGTEEYILILANKNTGFSKIMLADATGVKVSDLAYIEKSKWDSVNTEGYYLSLNNVEVIDIDNDGIMEILIELPRYEGDPAISLVKYKKGELSGDINIECSLLP